MSIADHIRIEKRFAELENEIARLRQELSHLKGRVTVLGKKEASTAAHDLYEASHAV